MTDGRPNDRGGGHAFTVATGILVSRIFGFLRQWIFARYLGNSGAAAAFAAATRIPNVLQNLLGEGSLSASFIPAYTGLRTQGKDAEASALAGTVFGLLSLVVGVIVALGVSFAGPLVNALAPGFSGHERELTIALVRLTFPATGFLVGSAWCLGILNSHRQFRLPYLAPVAWNVVIIAALLAFRHRDQASLIRLVGIAYVAGCVLQFGIQLPASLRALRTFFPWANVRTPAVKQVIRGFLPTVLTRGVVQVSAWVDLILASLTTSAAVSAMNYVQAIAMLPVSLFGMAIAAAELPELSAEVARGELAGREAVVSARLQIALERMSFFIAPSAVAFLLLGECLSGLLLESNRYGPNDSRFAWYFLIGCGLALPAQTAGRLYASAFYAFGDTKTPLRFAAVRVAVGVVIGTYAVLILPDQLAFPKELGAVFLTATTGCTAWLEWFLLRRALALQKGVIAAVPRLGRTYGAALTAGVVAIGIKVIMGAAFGTKTLTIWGGGFLSPPQLPSIPANLLILGGFCITYGGVALGLQVRHAQLLFRWFLKPRGSKSR